MKRRTRPNAPLNHDLHRRAFEHAMRILPARSFRKHRQITIRFEAELDLEDGFCATTVITHTQGIRMQLIKGWNSHSNFKPIILEKPHRILSTRLKQYRAALNAWQRAAEHPLTFRSFNILLAALSYDIQLSQSHD